MEEDDKGCPMIRIGASGECFFWYRVVPGKRPLNGCVCVCVCVCARVPLVMHHKLEIVHLICYFIRMMLTVGIILTSGLRCQYTKTFTLSNLNNF